MYNRRVIVTSFVAISLLLVSIIITRFTISLWRWKTNPSEQTGVTFTTQAPNLSAILDADSTTFNDMFFASSCAGSHAKKATIELYYENESGFNASLNAVLKLDSISSAHSGTINQSAINWALTTQSGNNCASGIIADGDLRSITAGNTDNAIIYSGDFGLGAIPGNTSMTSTTLYLYFWLDSDYDLVNTGNSVVTNPLQDMTLKVVWSGTITNVDSSPTLYSTITSQQIKTNPTFSTVPTQSESGLYTTTEGSSTIYYYRGIIENNNVLYDNKCWKILRTSKTGGIKMIYNGLPDTSGATPDCGGDIETSQSSDQSFAKLNGTDTRYPFDSNNSSNNDYRSSTLKTLVDSWLTNYVDDTLLETTNFCIDMEEDSVNSGGTYHQYMPATRYANRASGAPTLSCTGTDKYTISSKVGLITMDEVWFAGGIDTNEDSFLNNWSYWWTSSAYSSDSGENYTSVFRVDEYGTIGHSGVTSNRGVRPIVSLKPTVKYTGDGTHDNPYVPTNSSKQTLYLNIINSHDIKTNISSYSTNPTNEESGLYVTTQNNINIYFFRGNVNDNNVLYNDMCWKIIRTTQDKGIKMIYNGLPTTEGNVTRCGTNTTTSQTDSLALLDGTNEYYPMTRSVSGDSHSSNPDFRLTSLRTQLDTWFTNNVNTSLLENTDFCIDTQMDETITDDNRYTVWTRYIGDSTNPTLNCTGTNREVYTSKVGLITMDEAVFAGAPKVSPSNNYQGSNYNYYLFNGKGYWTMSPARYDSNYWNLEYVTVTRWGKLDKYWYANQNDYGVRPVVSLKPDVGYTGTGTYDNPYVPTN